MRLSIMQSHSRSKEDIRIVKEALSEMNSPFFTGRQIARKTGLSPYRVGVGLRFLRDQGCIEKISKRLWKKNIESPTKIIK